MTVPNERWFEEQGYVVGSDIDDRDLEAPLGDALAPPPSVADAIEHSWRPIDLGTIADGAEDRPAILGLLYPGRRHVWSGETESGKSWLALIAAAELARQGEAVVYIDAENGAREIRSRLAALGLRRDELTRILYLAPEEPFGDAIVRADVAEMLAAHKPALVVADAMDALLGLHGLDPNSARDVESYYRNVVEPLRQTGSAFLTLDNVVKNPDNRGRYAAGSGRKINAADVHLGFETIHPFGRGRTGRAKLTVHKDRPGFLPRPRAAELELRSDQNTGALAWALTPGESSEPGAFRPTGYMERVSIYLEQQTAPVQRKRIAEDVGGRTEWVYRAMKVLVAEGYATERERLGLVSERPFREAEDA